MTHHEKNPTPYLEANLILAEQQGDDSQVDALVAELLPGERRELAEACYRLARKLLVPREALVRDTILHWGDDDNSRGYRPGR